MLITYIWVALLFAALMLIIDKRGIALIALIALLIVLVPFTSFVDRMTQVIGGIR